MTRQRSIAAVLMAFMLLSMCSCGDKAEIHDTEAATESETESVAESTTAENIDKTADEADLKLISVTYKVDEVLSVAKVFVDNGASRTFNGDVTVSFKDEAGHSAGFDTIFVEDLNPGNETFANITVDETANLSMTFKISDYTFSEFMNSDNGTLDESTSKKLSDEFYSSFGGDGNPDYAASWYAGVETVQVFDSTDGDYAVITVNTTDKDWINSIGNAVFANYAKEYNDDYDLIQVIVQDESGNNLFTRSEN